MSLFSIFSIDKDRGLKRSDVEEVDDKGVQRAARLREVLGGETIYDIVQTDCQEYGKRTRQVEYKGSKRGSW